MLEFLKELLGTELYAQVAGKLKGHEDKVKNFVDISDGGYVPKTKLESETEKANSYKAQLDETKTQLAALKTAAGNSEELTKKISEMQEKYNADTAELNKRLAAQELDFSVSEKLRDAELKVRNPKTMMRLLDKSKLKKDGADIIGLKEQLEALGKEDPSLFLTDEGAGGAPVGTGGVPFTPKASPAGGGGDNPFSFNFVGVRAKPESK